MKATGIVRRVDDLGRVVIPKEIRRTLRIREGEPLEIFTEKDGEIIFKKYSPVGDISAFSSQCAEALSKNGGMPIAVCDKDSIVAVAGISKKDYLEKPISLPLSTLLSGRREYSAAGADGGVSVTDSAQGRVSCLAPIISDGDVVGAVMSLSNGGDPPGDTERKLVSAGAMFLARQTEI